MTLERRHLRYLSRMEGIGEEEKMGRRRQGEHRKLWERVVGFLMVGKVW